MFATEERASGRQRALIRKAKPRLIPLASLLTMAEQAAHAEHVAKLGDNAMWRRYLEPTPERAAL